MTRHRWAEAPADRSTAAGVAAARIVATDAHPATTTIATQRVVRRLRRIGCPFSLAGDLRAVPTEFPKAFPEPLTGHWGQSQALPFANSGEKRPYRFRNVPERASMARWHRSPP